jgi:hypothetical protein
MRAAAEAMEKPLILDNIERRCLFVVERTQPGLLAAVSGKPDTAPDQIAKRDPAAQLVEKSRWEGHRYLEDRGPLARMLRAGRPRSEKVIIASA